MNNTSVESFLAEGCGRCERFQTPQCKVHQWPKELAAVRKLLVASGLVEQMKWGFPCYSLDGKNVVTLTALKDACAVSFFKGAALVDADGVLEAPGPNSRFGRYLKFRSMAEVKARKPILERFLEQAIALERAGKKVERGEREPVPEELARRFERDAKLKRAFDALTPGRQRSHILFVSGAKQAETRERRVEKCAEDIVAGRGFNER